MFGFKDFAYQENNFTYWKDKNIKKRQNKQREEKIYLFNKKKKLLHGFILYRI